MRRPSGLFSMSALLPQSGAMGTRLLALGGGRETQGFLVLFDYHTNRCLSILDDSTLHMYRTGAPMGLASKYLARRDSRVVGCIGSAPMARGSLTMVRTALPSISGAKVYSPTKRHRERFAEEMSQQLQMAVTPVGSAEEAVDGADVVITATNADRPVVADSAIPEGAHLNLVARNEVSLAVLRRGKIVTAWTQALLELDPPMHEPIPQELIHAELSKVVVGEAPGRENETEITSFIGGTPVAMWDVAAASVFYEAGRRLGLGTEIQIDA
jgi:alanine dehydrogenase